MLTRPSCDGGLPRLQRPEPASTEGHARKRPVRLIVQPYAWHALDRRPLSRAKRNLLNPRIVAMTIGQVFWHLHWL